MGKKTFRESTKFLPNKLVVTIKSWLDYYMAVNQEYVLSESTLKYPICSYLSQFYGPVVLEKEIVFFSNDRCFDVYFKIGEEKYFIELKYAQKDYTYESSEIQRVFDDLMRLNAMSEYKHTNCMFIMCGSKKDFKNEFKEGRPSVSTQTPVNGIPISQKSKKRGRPRKYGNNNPYRQMFSFVKGKPKIIKAGNTSIKKMVQEFENAYSLSNKGARKFKDISSCVSYLKKMKTTLIDIIYDDNETTGRSAIGLWKIERV